MPDKRLPEIATMGLTKWVVALATCNQMQIRLPAGHSSKKSAISHLVKWVCIWLWQCKHVWWVGFFIIASTFCALCSDSSVEAKMCDILLANSNNSNINVVWSVSFAITVIFLAVKVPHCKTKKVLRVVFEVTLSYQWTGYHVEEHKNFIKNRCQKWHCILSGGTKNKQWLGLSKN